MKWILIVTVLAIGFTTASGYAYANGNRVGSEYGGDGMGQGMMEDCGNNDAEYYHPDAAGRNGWTREQKQKFLDDTVELRKEMYNKRFEYKDALRNPKNTRQQFSKMEKEMIDLREKIYDKAPQNQETKQNILAVAARNDKLPDPIQ